MNSKLNDEKWISGLAPDSTVAAAARTSLQHRLQAVIDCLGWVAEGSNIDEQSIHLLRVWIRRSMAVLVLYRSVLPKKETRRVRRILKRIRRDAGATRDLDILLQRAATGGFGESTRFSGRLQRRRDEALQPVRQRCRRLLRRGRLSSLLHTLLAQIADDRESRQPFASWSHAALQRIVRRFYEAAQHRSQDLRAMHRFRKRAKDVRYTIELFSPVCSAECRDAAYSYIVNLQDRLGMINDDAAAISKLEKWIAARPSKAQRSEWKLLKEEANERLEEANNSFREWWSTAEMPMQASLTRLIGIDP